MGRTPKHPKDQHPAIAEVATTEVERARQWGVYVRDILKKKKNSDERLMFASVRSIAGEMHIDAATLGKWIAGERYASRDGVVRFALWAGQERTKVMRAAGWNPDEDIGYPGVQKVGDAIRAATDLTPERKQELLASVDLAVDPHFMYDPIVQSWSEYIRAVLNQRIPSLEKAERIALFVRLAQADLAKHQQSSTSHISLAHLDQPSGGEQ